MTRLVHLTSSAIARRLLRRGIARSRFRGERPTGVYCMPVLPSFYATHQWLRELKRGGARSISAIDFKIDDDEPVRVGHYGGPQVEVAAARAVRLLRQQPDPRGYEVIVLRRIEPAEIVRVREVPQVIGWRYRPDAHGRRPCPCPICLPRGAIKSRRLREPDGD